MTITNKDSILKKYYELNGQQTLFGYDNLEFKTINHPTPDRFVDLCSEFKLKKFNQHSTHSHTPVLHLSSLTVYRPAVSLRGGGGLLSVLTV